VQTTTHPRRRRRLELLWYLISFGYSIFRIALADRFVRKYGLNVWAFGAVEFGATIPYAVGTAKLVESLIDHDGRTARWGIIATVGFIAPDVFILLTTNHAPKRLFGVIGLWLLVAGGIAVSRIRSSVREHRHRPNQESDSVVSRGW